MPGFQSSEIILAIQLIAEYFDPSISGNPESKYMEGLALIPDYQPIPLPAPVTKAFFPSNLKLGNFG